MDDFLGALAKRSHRNMNFLDVRWWTTIGCTIVYHSWLVVWLPWILFSHILGMSSSQLTFIFFRGVQTTNQIVNVVGVNTTCDGPPGRKVWTPTSEIGPHHRDLDDWAPQIQLQPRQAFLEIVWPGRKSPRLWFLRVPYGAGVPKCGEGQGHFCRVPFMYVCIWSYTWLYMIVYIIYWHITYYVYIVLYMIVYINICIHAHMYIVCLFKGSWASLHMVVNCPGEPAQRWWNRWR